MPSQKNPIRRELATDSEFRTVCSGMVDSGDGTPCVSNTWSTPA
jgi:hypothetical protein